MPKQWFSNSWLHCPSFWFSTSEVKHLNHHFQQVHSVTGGPWPHWETFHKTKTGCGGQAWETLCGNQAGWGHNWLTKNHRRLSGPGLLADSITGMFSPHVWNSSLGSFKEKFCLSWKQIKVAARGMVHKPGVAMTTVMGDPVELRKMWVRKKRWKPCAKESAVWFIKNCYTCGSPLNISNSCEEIKSTVSEFFKEWLTGNWLVDS